MTLPKYVITSGLSVLIHGIITPPDVTSCDKQILKYHQDSN